MKRFHRTIISCFIIFLGSKYAEAQNPVITISNDLSFGMVITNTTSTITPTDFEAGQLKVDFPSYNGYVYISVTFTLPGNLASGINNLPITFSANSAAWNTTNSLTGSTLFNPSTGYAKFFNSTTPFTLYFWLGGSISPPSNQQAGTYTGSITVTASAFTFWPNFNTYQASQSLNASATIIRGLTMTSTGALDFGLVVAGTTPPSLSAQAGSAPSITTAGGSGRRITVNYSTSITLNDTYGHTLTFTPSVYGSNVYTNQAGSVVLPSGSNVYLSGSGRVTGYFHFWLGGSLAPIPTGQPPGNYSGTFTISVNY